jgi:predicted glycoside hydrolase/deacetylase ChbG (UPF0249 family)
MKTLKIIWHSDDMGATPQISSRIIEAWEKGLLDGFSIFGDASCPEIFKKSLDARPDQKARLAVHLNLWEGKPLLPARDVPRLVDADGFFNIEFLGLLKRYILCSRNEKTALLNEVEREWRAQIKTVLSMIKPRALTAIDGHIHMHMLPFLFRIAVRLAKEFNIPEIRIVREPIYLAGRAADFFSKNFMLNLIKRAILGVCAAWDTRMARMGGIAYPDAMLGILYSGMMSRENIKKGIRTAEKRGAKNIEVLVHIGKADASELDRWKGSREKADFVLSPSRDREYEDLALARKCIHGSC